MNPIELYIQARDEQVRQNIDDHDLKVYTSRYFSHLVRTNYSKNFTWMGVPIIQCPSDLMVMQEIICEIQPDFVIETGIAFGGMTQFYDTILDAASPCATLVSVDIEFREHTRAIFEHLMTCGTHIPIELSSTDPKTINIIRESIDSFIAEIYDYDECFDYPRVLVSLDSNHTHDHVLQELKLYSPLVSVGSYIVVFDTAIEYFPPLETDRPWGAGNNPATAVAEFMEGNTEFIVDKEVEARAGVSAAPGGWLKRIKGVS